MLKKIPTSQVRLGMYLQGLEGSWLSHPFWKTKFVVRDPADLQALQQSGVPYCLIDTAQGLDIELSRPAEPVAAPPPSAPTPKPRAAPRVTMAEELDRAAKLVGRSKQAVTALFGEARMGRAIDSEQCLPLVEEVATSVARNPSALISLARLKTADDYTYMHSVAVCGLMIALARQLGLDEARTREAGLAGLLHDVGKMAMPIEVLNKPGSLTDAEFAVMRSHPQRGFDMLESGSAVPESALDVCLHHHEKIDGSGYPQRLQGEQISEMARMGAVCDVYDAITSTRPYKAPWGPADSIGRMAQWSGHFDTAIFQAFVKSVGIYPVGTLVKLQSGRLAVVTDQNAQALTAPWVRVFYSTKSKMPVPLELLDLSASGTSERITGRENAADWGFKQLDQLWNRPAGG